MWWGPNITTCSTTNILLLNYIGLDNGDYKLKCSWDFNPTHTGFVQTILLTQNVDETIHIAYSLYSLT